MSENQSKRGQNGVFQLETSDYKVRPLKRGDVENYLRLLEQLSIVGDWANWDEAKQNSVFDAIDSSEHTKIFVAADVQYSKKLLGAVTILMEQKF